MQHTLYRLAPELEKIMESLRMGLMMEHSVSAVPDGEFLVLMAVALIIVGVSASCGDFPIISFFLCNFLLRVHRI